MASSCGAGVAAGRSGSRWVLSGAVLLPDHPWLSRQWTRQKVEVAETALDQLGSLHTHPIVGRAFPPDVIQGITRLWDRRQEGLDRLEALPQTFCHLDAFRRNMFLHIPPGGSSELILIDWANSASQYLLQML